MARTDVKPPEPINIPGITEGSTTPISGVTPAVEEEGILWDAGSTLRGGPAAKSRTTAKTYKSKAYAKSAFKTGTLPKSQMDMINSAYAKYGKALGFKKASSLWNSIVDTSDSSRSPFQILSQIGGEGLDGEITGAGGGGGRTSYTDVNIQQYDKTLSDTLLDSTLLSTFGRKASDAEKARFFKELNTAAKAGTVSKTRTKGGKRVTTTTQKFDQEAFVDKYTGTVLEGMLSGGEPLDLGGEAGKIQDALRKYSSDMGVIRSDRDILADVRRVIKGETTADDAAMEVRKQAASLYKNYAERLKIDPEYAGTVRDLINPYVKLMADTFEQDMESISLTNPTIQNLLASDKAPTYGDFYKQLRGMSEFRNTTTAKKEASSLANNLASMMGF